MQECAKEEKKKRNLKLKNICFKELLIYALNKKRESKIGQ